jgi:hypothetical protein
LGIKLLLGILGYEGNKYGNIQVQKLNIKYGESGD